MLCFGQSGNRAIGISGNQAVGTLGAEHRLVCRFEKGGYLGEESRQID